MLIFTSTISVILDFEFVFPDGFFRKDGDAEDCSRQSCFAGIYGGGGEMGKVRRSYVDAKRGGGASDMSAREKSPCSGVCTFQEGSAQAESPLDKALPGYVEEAGQEAEGDVCPARRSSDLRGEEQNRHVAFSRAVERALLGRRSRPGTAEGQCAPERMKCSSVLTSQELKFLLG